eukprot:5284931-Alexandrium_andersonii.AAC.1
MAVRSMARGISLLSIPVETRRVRLALCRVVWATTRSDIHIRCDTATHIAVLCSCALSRGAVCWMQRCDGVSMRSACHANLPARSRLCAQHVGSQVCQPVVRNCCVAHHLW